jgi:integrase
VFIRDKTAALASTRKSLVVSAAKANLIDLLKPEEAANPTGPSIRLPASGHRVILVSKPARGRREKNELSGDICPEVTCASIALATQAIRRKRGPSLSRRIGQRGNVFQKGLSKAAWNPEIPAYGRFWIDAPGQDRKRKVIALGVCPTASVAMRKLRELIDASGVNDNQTFIEATAPATTFRSKALNWLDSLFERKRRPIKPATIRTWQSCLDKWLVPILGDMPLEDVGNAAMKTVVNRLLAAGLSAKSIVNYCAVVKLVVASAVDAEGEQIHPRKWNHEFVGLPIVDKTKQRRPTLTADEVASIVSASKPRYKPLFALMAGTGLRIGEALALKTTDFSEDCTTLRVQHSMWSGREQMPKTANAIRTVDIPEPLAAMLRRYISGKQGYIFPTSSGRPINQRNVHRTLSNLAGKGGVHAFRRFRTYVLRKASAPEDLVRLWLGHAGNSVTDLYALQLREDVPFRREWADKCGLGFELGYAGLQNAPLKDAVVEA